MRIAFLTYRGSPTSGGQGVYTYYLTRALSALGHRVEVFSGQPYPNVASDVRLVEVASLDLYRPDDPFRTPSRHEFRDAIDLLEYGLMCTAAFPEPLTFSLRAARELARRRSDFDIVHDNQSLGYGLLTLPRGGLPVVATIHHPISLDRDLELAAAPTAKKRLSLRRWYGFARMQRRVARRLDRLIAVSESARSDAIQAFGLEPDRVAFVHNGVDSELFRPVPQVGRRPGRIIATASADVPLKGLVYLLEATAKLRTERDVDLVVVGKAPKADATRRALERFDLQDAVRFESDVEPLELVSLYAEAEVAVVPSLYEGFSLPALEAMSCGVPLVATTGGAVPEVTGPDGEAARLVPPADAGALASALAHLLDDPALRARMGAAGRARAVRNFSWERTAQAVVAQYARTLERC